MEAIIRTLLEKLSTRPVLVYPDWGTVTDKPRPFLLYCYASVDYFGATLEQEQNESAMLFLSLIHI